MDEHQTVSSCVGHQFKDGITCMCLSTCHRMNNMARAVNSTCQTQGHLDGAFNWCKKDFALIGFGMNSMGAHFNPLSVSIVNSESKDAISSAYEATCNGLYTLYNSAAYPAPLVPANPDAQNVPSFRRWRFEMKRSPLIQPFFVRIPVAGSAHRSLSRSARMVERSGSSISCPTTQPTCTISWRSLRATALHLCLHGPKKSLVRTARFNSVAYTFRVSLLFETF
jgi:hypothetical protein